MFLRCNLQETTISDEGIKNAIKSISSLKNLSLLSLLFLQHPIGENAHDLAKLISSLPLTGLIMHLTQCQIENDGALAIVQAIKSNILQKEGYACLVLRGNPVINKDTIKAEETKNFDLDVRDSIF